MKKYIISVFMSLIFCMVAWADVTIHIVNKSKDFVHVSAYNEGAWWGDYELNPAQMLFPVGQAGSDYTVGVGAAFDRINEDGVANEEGYNESWFGSRWTQYLWNSYVAADRSGVYFIKGADNDHINSNSKCTMTHDGYVTAEIQLLKDGQREVVWTGCS